MTKWKYRLPSGNALRDAIDDADEGDCAEGRLKLLDCLENCITQIHKLCPDDFDEYQCGNFIDSINSQRSNIEDYDEDICSWDDIEVEINGLLSEFWDLCDVLRIWADC